MADFGPSVTQVVGPQEAGSQPIAPVQEQLPASGWGAALATVGQAAGQLAGTIVKQERTTADNAFLKQLADSQSLINTGVEQGSVPYDQADTRTRHLYNTALAARPDLADKIGSIAGVFQKTTVAGDVQDQKAQAAKIEEQGLNQAIANGYQLNPNASKQERAAVIQASQSGIKMNKELAATYAANAEKRSQGSFDEGVAKRNLEVQTTQLAAQFGGDNLNALNTQLEALRQRVTSGDLKDNPQQAQVEWTRIYGTYEGGLNAIGGTNPQLVAGWQTSFKNMYETGQKYLDPKADEATLKSQKESILTRSQINMLQSNPKLRDVAAVSQLMGSTPITTLIATPEIANVLSGAISTPVTNGQSASYRDPIVGSPSETAVVGSLRKAVSQINSGGFHDEAKARIETANGINNVLVETGRVLNSGATPKSLAGLANFFASDEYGSWVKNGKIDPIAQQTAAKTFQIVYQPAVTSAIGDKLKGDLIPASEDGTQTAVSLAQGLDVKMGPGGTLQFVPTASMKLSPDQQKVEATTITNLKDVQTALNTMVHLGAHMEGTTDYAAHWEKNKYYYLPQVYPVKPGQTVGNLQWSGDGDWRDKNTWRKVGQR